MHYLCPMKKNLLETDRYFVAGSWIILTFMFCLQVLPQTQSAAEALLFSGILMASIYPPATYLSRKLLRKALKTGKMKRFVCQFLAFSVLTGSIFGALLFLFHHLEERGVFPHSEYFKLGKTPHHYAVFILLSAGIFINLILCGLRFLLEYIKAQKIILEHQLRTLQHQVTPHFMFNVLNHIHVLMQSDVELASSLLIKYSEILRYQLYNGEKERVALTQEIRFLEDFIAVEQLRWEGKLTVVRKWDVKNEELEVPSLLFITFVENAFKHVSKSGLEKGFIHMGLEQRENRICFFIENSKSKIEKKKNHKGLGLKNIKERLEILFYNRHDLTIEETESVFRVRLALTL